MLWVLGAAGAAVVVWLVISIGSTLLFFRAVESDPERFLDDAQSSPDGESLCLSCVHAPELPSCPNTDLLGDDSSPNAMYCGWYREALEAHA